MKSMFFIALVCSAIVISSKFFTVSDIANTSATGKALIENAQVIEGNLSK